MLAAIRRLVSLRNVGTTISILLALLLILAVVIQAATVSQAAPNRISESPADSQSIVWPERNKPGRFKFSLNNSLQFDFGSADKGIYGNCHIYQLPVKFKGYQFQQGYVLLIDLSGTEIYEPLKINISSKGDQLVAENQNWLYAGLLHSKTKPAKGTIIFLPGIESLSKHEISILESIQQAGWNVLFVTVGERTFTRRTISIVDESDDPSIEHDEGATKFAKQIDNHLADRAYGVESMLQFLRNKKPEFLQEPIALVGLSAGAISLPAVAARIDPPDAAILIAGGENVAKIMATSPLFKEHTYINQTKRYTVDGKTEISTNPVTDPEVLKKLVDETLELTHLDPKKTAKSLQKVPTLMLHAKYDCVVPAKTGIALYHTLGKPERWTYPCGHVGLVYMTKWKIHPVLEWIEKEASTP